MALGTELVLGTAPPERAGAASALLESGSELGGALGMALLGSIGNAVYHAEAADSVRPAPGGLPDGAVDAARESLSGAVAVAGRLPGQTGDAVLAAASEAFTRGLHATVIGRAAVMAAAAALSIVLLRNVTLSNRTEAETGGGGAHAGAGGSALRPGGPGGEALRTQRRPGEEAVRTLSRPGRGPVPAGIPGRGSGRSSSWSRGLPVLREGPRPS
ncbi:hypothetical protein [Streptomyces sp. 7N604]|uniref:hypothetical protein n=1 Tax=Streptomyces sp. 7N604 TaxID=3457415 RepID=UPI003FD053F4